MLNPWKCKMIIFFAKMRYKLGGRMQYGRANDKLPCTNMAQGSYDRFAFR